MKEAKKQLIQASQEAVISEASRMVVKFTMALLSQTIV